MDARQPLCKKQLASRVTMLFAVYVTIFVSAGCLLIYLLFLVNVCRSKDSPTVYVKS